MSDCDHCGHGAYFHWKRNDGSTGCSSCKDWGRKAHPPIVDGLHMDGWSERLETQQATANDPPPVYPSAKKVAVAVRAMEQASLFLHSLNAHPQTFAEYLGREPREEELAALARVSPQYWQTGEGLMLADNPLFK